MITAQECSKIRRENKIWKWALFWVPGDFFDFEMRIYASFESIVLQIGIRMITSVGIDLGSSKTVIVDDSADLVRTDTGGISRPTLVAFTGRSRLSDEAAAAQSNRYVVK